MEAPCTATYTVSRRSGPDGATTEWDAECIVWVIYGDTALISKINGELQIIPMTQLKELK